MAPCGKRGTAKPHPPRGLFARVDWLRLLSRAGFRAKVVPFEHSELEPGRHELVVCSRAR